MVGYRRYNRENTAVNFCFGHGLSYTSFCYGDLKIRDREVSLKVKNEGAVPGKETVQLYILGDEMQQLRHFEKVELCAGEEKSVVFRLTDRDFSAFNEEKGQFVPVPGIYQVQIGASSRDIRLVQTVQIPEL